MKILVPVDFYKTSFAAFNYAANFSQMFDNAEITLLHVVNGTFNTGEVIMYDPMLLRKEAAMSRLDFFIEELPQEMEIKLPKIKIHKEVRFGIPGFTIADYANEHDIDMIIMGTRDQHSLFDKILGSASAISLRTAKCPVMLIHENAKFNELQKIVFAFDEKSEIENAIEDYRKINNVIKAKTEFIHVNTKKIDDISAQTEEIVEELFENHNPQFSFEIKALKGSSVHHTIKDYCIFEKSDMLVMVHRKEGIFSSMFRSHKSVRMAQEFHLPVLVLHESK